MASYRARLSQRGVVRFELQASQADRELFRALARKLTEAGEEAQRIRLAIRREFLGEPGKRSGVLTALRRSPLVGGGGSV